MYSPVMSSCKDFSTLDSALLFPLIPYFKNILPTNISASSSCAIIFGVKLSASFSCMNYFPKKLSACFSLKNTPQIILQLLSLVHHSLSLEFLFYKINQIIPLAHFLQLTLHILTHTITFQKYLPPNFPPYLPSPLYFILSLDMCMLNSLKLYSKFPLLVHYSLMYHYPFCGLHLLILNNQQ